VIYEMYEPDPDDEFYDEMVTAAFQSMFNRGIDWDAAALPDECYMEVCA